jgi:hypothetical protein
MASTGEASRGSFRGRKRSGTIGRVDASRSSDWYDRAEDAGVG